MSVYQYGKFLLFGDSITQYSSKQIIEPGNGQIQFSIAAALTNDYQRKLEVITRGFDGYNSEQALHILPEILKYEHDTKPAPEQIKLAWIFFGTNDSSVGGDHIQHVPTGRYAENMETLIRLLQSRGIKVIAVKPGTHDETLADEAKLRSRAKRSNELQKQYGDALGEVCGKLEVPTVDLYDVFINSGLSSAELLSDGIHFTGTAYQLMYNELMKVISANYPELHPDNIPQKLPPWREATLEKLKAYRSN
ncbi:hypothetical protein KL911_001242 [Ogataea haglerorum]|uniref:uncharacterized protein n=1 Tax=Ogataea haglerorum TaxID=1937702 RepID=UPI001C8A9316|nr:uncharacterized protein KL911_001242 [Ogataea haglerorum]KAG7756440.1 hypothetical protein KL911_001242 [Ogataea haglerorum]